MDTQNTYYGIFICSRLNRSNERSAVAHLGRMQVPLCLSVLGARGRHMCASAPSF